MLKIKSVLPRDRSIISIFCKNNTQKVLSIIATEGAVSTKSNIPYLSIYSEFFFLTFTFPLLHVLLSYLSSLVLLMRLTPATNPGSLS